MKSTLLITLTLAIVGSLGLFSCKKEFVDRSCEKVSTVECGFDSTKVNVRVVNFTGYPLCDFSIIYRADTKDVYEYGTLGVGETSCYTKVAFTYVYPEVTFTLGTGKYKINDSLIERPKYNSLRQIFPGFYTYIINIPSLDEEELATFFITDDI